MAQAKYLVRLLTANYKLVHAHLVVASSVVDNKTTTTSCDNNNNNNMTTLAHKIAVNNAATRTVLAINHAHVQATRMQSAQVHCGMHNNALTNEQ